MEDNFYSAQPKLKYTVSIEDSQLPLFPHEATKITKCLFYYYCLCVFCAFVGNYL